MKRKTHDEYVAEVFVKTSDIEVLGEYINSHVKILHRCKVCGCEWYALPTNVLNGSRCPICANVKRSQVQALTQKEYVDRLLDVNSGVEFIGRYTNLNTKSLHRCRMCGNEWMAYPNNILKGKGCKKCFDKKNADHRRKTNDYYARQVASLNNNIIALGTYISARTPILHRCAICGYEWDITPDNILRGHGCPMCSYSNGEKAIQEYLRSRLIDFRRQYIFDDCKNKKSLRFDFYIPDTNTCIEYDGIQHFEPVEYFGGVEAFIIRQRNDAIKNDYCLSHGIILLRIKYDQDINSVLNNFFNNTKLIEEAV